MAVHIYRQMMDRLHGLGKKLSQSKSAVSARLEQPDDMPPNIWGFNILLSWLVLRHH